MFDSGQHQEAALSDDHENAAPVDVRALQVQLKSLAAERDREAFEKSEIVERANAISLERDDLREKLKSETAQRERLASENSRLTAEVSATARALAEATRRADAAAAEVASLRKALEAGPGNDPLALLWAVTRQKTAAGVAFLRSKIPENHPALPWFDKAVEISTRLGCLAARFALAFAKWLKAEGLPRAKVLAEKLLAEVEARLAKK